MSDERINIRVTEGRVIQKGEWLLGYDPSNGSTTLLKKITGEEAKDWWEHERVKRDILSDYITTEDFKRLVTAVGLRRRSGYRLNEFAKIYMYWTGGPNGVAVGMPTATNIYVYE